MRSLYPIFRRALTHRLAETAVCLTTNELETVEGPCRGQNVIGT